MTDAPVIGAGVVGNAGACTVSEVLPLAEPGVLRDHIASGPPIPPVLQPSH